MKMKFRSLINYDCLWHSAVSSLPVQLGELQILNKTAQSVHHNVIQLQYNSAQIKMDFYGEGVMLFHVLIPTHWSVKTVLRSGKCLLTPACLSEGQLIQSVLSLCSSSSDFEAISFSLDSAN